MFEGTDDDEQDNEPTNNKLAVSGIVNYGNTCFINSLIQALASIKSFEAMLSEMLKNKKNHK